MNKIIIIVLLAVELLSCKNTEKEIDRVAIAKQYFEVLDKSDYSKMSNWFGDSLQTIEGGHSTTYAIEDYLELLKWDAVFDPTYEILEIEQKGDVVIAKISKMDKRILFLHEKPFITSQTVSFQNDKIIKVETAYVNFDYPTWDKNKNSLLTWVNENHPELNGFIHDQTEKGGLKFLKAIELYKNRK
ncbi:hypothetical protein ACJRPK_16065 [Aquimarina sp. 2-A2]|uniref:hypothetical protein n=1 Tax=Aquimarina sp. 2-A2 TaxID=3382644 RepID=UPI00387F054A